MTTEIITEFAFGKTADLIEEMNDEFDSWFLDAFDVGSQNVGELQYNAFLRNLVKVIPRRAARLLNPKLRSILDLAQVFQVRP